MAAREESVRLLSPESVFFQADGGVTGCRKIDLGATPGAASDEEKDRRCMIAASQPRGTALTSVRLRFEDFALSALVCPGRTQS